MVHHGASRGLFVVYFHSASRYQRGHFVHGSTHKDELQWYTGILYTFHGDVMAFPMLGPMIQHVPCNVKRSRLWGVAWHMFRATSIGHLMGNPIHSWSMDTSGRWHIHVDGPPRGTCHGPFIRRAYETRHDNTPGHHLPWRRCHGVARGMDPYRVRRGMSIVVWPLHGYLGPSIEKPWPKPKPCHNNSNRFEGFHALVCFQFRHIYMVATGAPFSHSRHLHGPALRRHKICTRHVLYVRF